MPTHLTQNTIKHAAMLPKRFTQPKFGTLVQIFWEPKTNTPFVFGRLMANMGPTGGLPKKLPHGPMGLGGLEVAYLMESAS